MREPQARPKDKERWSLLLRFLKEKDKITLERINHSKLGDQTDTKNPEGSVATSTSFVI